MHEKKEKCMHEQQERQKKLCWNGRDASSYHNVENKPFSNLEVLQLSVTNLQHSTQFGLNLEVLQLSVADL